MDFIGRDKELELLESEYKRESSFVVIYGRRRVGKTTLIKEFIKNKKALYFLATEELEMVNIRSFTRNFANFSGQEYLNNAKFDNWEKVFEAFSQYDKNQKKILVIDEFQYLITVNSAFASIFQKAWDLYMKENNIMVIICGSLISMMTNNVLSYKSPLYGRRTSQIRLMPIKFYEIKKSLKNISFKDLVELYSVTDGIPKYIGLFDLKKSLKENIETEILNKNGFLFEEPTFLLEREVRDIVSYFSIIKVIAEGNHKLSSIGSALELKGSQITPYLKVLMDLDIIEKKVPVTEKYPEKSRKGLYFIKDNFILFWFKFIAPYRSELEIDNTGIVKNKLNKNFIDNHVSFIFGKISIETLRKLISEKKINYTFQRIGSYWDRNIEIDICAVNEEENEYLFGECKYLDKKVDIDVYFNLLKKVESIHELKNTKNIYAIFSKSGFTKRLLDIAFSNKNVLLINNGTLCTKLE